MTNSTNTTLITASSISVTYSIAEQVGALAIVVAFSLLLGGGVGLLGGFTFPGIWKFKGYYLKPIIKGIVLPPLIFMIIAGLIARNQFGTVMKPYPTLWTSYIRSICLSLLLVRGGLQVKFRGQGLLVLLLAIVPQICEAVVVAFIAYGLFNLPLVICFCMAYVISCISPSVVVPGLISLNDAGYGRKNGLTTSLIAAGTFDDIICIICFGICKTIAYTEYHMNDGTNIGLAIGYLFIQNVVGFGAGIILGIFGWFFKFISNKRIRINCKFVYCIVCAIAFVLVGEQSGYADSKYITSLTFGYVCFRFWGDDKPQKEIYWLWFFIQPLFFGSVGAALLFTQIRASDLGYGAVCIIIGVIVRIIAVFAISYIKPSLMMKERLFMGVAWIAKATVQAALAGVILKDGTSKKNDEMKAWGNIIQTVSIFSIILCAPTGAVLLNSLGPKFLPKDVKSEEQAPTETARTMVTQAADNEQQQQQDNQVAINLEQSPISQTEGDFESPIRRKSNENLNQIDGSQSPDRLIKLEKSLKNETKISNI